MDRTASGAGEGSAPVSGAKAPLEEAAAALLQASSTDLYRNRAWEVAPGKTKQYYLGKAQVAVVAYLNALLEDIPYEVAAAAWRGWVESDNPNRTDYARNDEVVAALFAAFESLRDSAKPGDHA